MGKSKQPTSSRRQYTQEAMDNAILAVLTDQMSKRQAAAFFHVPKTTLLDKTKGKYAVAPQPRTILTPEEEKMLVEWLQVTSARGCGKNREDLCLAIQRILKGEGRKNPFTDDKPGPSWYRGFLKRHPNIRERKPMVLGDQRARVSEQKIKGWFTEAHDSLLKDGVDITKVPLSNVFNCDETGFPFFLQGSTVLSDVNNKHPYELGSDSKQQITVLGCCSAAGDVLPPSIIFPGMRWTWRPWEDFKEAHFSLTPNGWINSEVFLKWLQETFLPAIENLPRPVVLFADGHQSHVNMDVHDFCVKHKITYYVLPAHASHIIQPLDLVFYGSLKNEWRKSVHDFKTIARVAAVSKTTFSRVFRDAWTQAYTQEKIAHAFEASGLAPWNPERPDYSKCEASFIYGKVVRPRETSVIVPASYEEPLPLQPPSLHVTTEETSSDHQASNNDIKPPGQVPQPPESQQPLSLSITTDTNDHEVPSDTNQPIVPSPPQPATPQSPLPHVATSPPQPTPSQSTSPPQPTPSQSTSPPQPTPSQSTSPPQPTHSPLEQPNSPALSPAYVALPPLSPSPPPSPLPPPSSCERDLPGPSTEYGPLQPAPENDTIPPLFTSDIPYLSSQPETDYSFTDGLDIGFKVDQLIDHVVSCGWSLSDMHALRKRQIRNVEPKSNETSYRKYVQLYNAIVPPATFNNLPVPKNWYDKTGKTPRIQAPKYVSGKSFKEFHEGKAKEVEEKKRAVEEKKNERAKKKAEKDKAREEEKEKRKEEREAKRKARIAEKEQAKKAKKPRMQTVELVSESEDSEKIIYMDGSSGDECMEMMCREKEVDDSVCFVCGDDRDLDGWIGCDMCERWFHRGCTGGQRERVQCMSEEELSEFQFVCDVCSVPKLN